jgi:hypothetical protein
MEDQKYFILIKELVFFCFSIQFAYLSPLVISIQVHIAPDSQITTIISITTR